MNDKGQVCGTGAYRLGAVYLRRHRLRATFLSLATAKGTINSIIIIYQVQYSVVK